MGYFIDTQGGYYEGDRAHSLDQEVPQRPTADHTWGGAQWVAPAPAVLLQQKAEQAVNEQEARDRLAFEVNFDQENRIRVLEGKPVITKLQYKNALIAAWKALQS